MTKIISSLAEAEARGIYGYFVRALAAAKAVGTGRVVIVCQLPWGPVSELTAFESAGVFRSKFAPAGMPRTGVGYNLAIKFPWVDLWLVRVTGAGAAAAAINAQKAGALDCVAIPAKYVGSGGNGITAVVAAATNGIANSFDLTLTKTNSTTGKSTVEKIPNVDSDRTDAAYWTALTSNSVLVGPLVKSSVGRPVNGTYTLAAGTDGAAVVAADYVGTPGAADKGIAVCETDSEISFVLCDDVGAGILATVNTGLQAHQLFMNDRRLCLLTGNPGETYATAKTNSALNQSEACHYVWPHGKVVDEDAVSDTSDKITIPLTGALACIASIMQPHLSPAFKRRDFTKALAAIKELDVSTSSGQIHADLEKNGVLSFERNEDGVFSPYSSIASDGITPMWATRMRRFLMFSMGNALTEYRNGPNEDQTQSSERDVCQGFLERMVENLKRDPYFLPGLNSAGLLPEETTNTQADIDGGDYTIGFQAKLVSEQKRIILAGEVGESVTVEIQR